MQPCRTLPIVQNQKYQDAISHGLGASHILQNKIQVKNVEAVNMPPLKIQDRPSNFEWFGRGVRSLTLAESEHESSGTSTLVESFSTMSNFVQKKLVEVLDRLEKEETKTNKGVQQQTEVYIIDDDDSFPSNHQQEEIDCEIITAEEDPNVCPFVNTRGSNRLGFKVLTTSEKLSIFRNKRDDLFYKTFGRAVRKFLEDDFVKTTGYDKKFKGNDGKYYYEHLVLYAKIRNFHKFHSFGLERMV